MKFVSYKILNIDEKGIKFEAVFDTETKIKFISSAESSRDEFREDENGYPVLDEKGKPIVDLVKFNLYDAKSPESIDRCIKEWAKAYINGKQKEEDQKRNNTPSEEVKKLFNKNFLV